MSAEFKNYALSTWYWNLKEHPENYTIGTNELRKKIKQYYEKAIKHEPQKNMGPRN